MVDCFLPFFPCEEGGMGSPTSIPVNFSSVAGEQNKTSDTGCKIEQEDWTFSVVPVYVIVIAGMGIVLNLFVLMVFCLHKKPCNIPEIYLSNLAAADLLLVSCLPFWAVYISNVYHWPFGEFLCKVVNTGIHLNVYCSIYFLVLVSMDRYLALVHPLTQEKFRRTLYAKVGCILVWILGVLLSVPALVYRGIKNYQNSTRCFLDYPSIEINLLCDSMISILSFAIPISIILFCTLKIIKALRNRLTEGVNIQKTDNRATTLVLVVLLAFLICWVPFHLFKIMEMFIRAGVIDKCIFRQLWYICQQIFVYLAFFNSVLNPVLYVIVGKNFRKKVKELHKQLSLNRTSTLSLSSTTSSYFTRSVKVKDALTGSACL